MKYLSVVVILALATSLTSCGKFERATASLTGRGSETCQGGVLYLQFTSGVSVAYNPNGSIKTC